MSSIVTTFSCLQQYFNYIGFLSVKQFHCSFVVQLQLLVIWSMSLNQNKRLLFFTLSWTNRLSLVMHCQKNVSLSTHIDMFEWIITNFAGSCPGYIPRKLRLAVCMFHILGLQIFLTEQIVFNTFKCRHCIY